VEIGQLVGVFYSQLWNRWNDDAVDSVLAPDFAFRGSLGVEVMGRQGWRGYRELVRAGSSDFHNDVVTLVVAGNQAAARLVYSGTHDGSLAGMPATGKRFTYSGAAFFTAEQGLLTSAWVLGDLSSLRDQLGPGS
jgi:steroid delta-isomerase-like uncharacterized protein